MRLVWLFLEAAAVAAMRLPRPAASMASAATLPANAPATSGHVVPTSGHVPASPRGEEAADALFEEAVRLCQRRIDGEESISLAGVPGILDLIAAGDFAHWVQSDQQTRSVVDVGAGLCPVEGADGQLLAGDDLIQFQMSHTQPGRQCSDGVCSLTCSRISLSALATPAETDQLRRRAAHLMDSGLATERAPFETSLSFGECARAGDARTALLYLRLIERLRRVVADEYGLRTAPRLDPTKLARGHSDTSCLHSSPLSTTSQGPGRSTDCSQPLSAPS